MTHVYFTMKNSLTDPKLAELIGEEGVGYEDDFSSSAKLLFIPEPGVINEVRGPKSIWPAHRADSKGSLGPDGYIPIGQCQFLPPRYFDPFEAVWITFWSAFRYGRLRPTAIPSGPEFSGVKEVWLYEGAASGWLAQDLLPDFGEVKVLRVSGSFGTCDSVERYDQRVRRLSKLVEPLFEVLREVGAVVPSADASWFAATVFSELGRSKWLEGEGDEIPIEKIEDALRRKYA